MGYLLIVTRVDGHTINMSLDFNVTEITLSSQDGLEDNQRYFYTIATFSNVGTVAMTDNAQARFFGKITEH